MRTYTEPLKALREYEECTEALLKKKIPHDYTIRPGGHNHSYWRNAILYQLIFFTEHFKRNISR